MVKATRVIIVLFAAGCPNSNPSSSRKDVFVITAHTIIPPKADEYGSYGFEAPLVGMRLRTSWTHLIIGVVL